MVDPLTTTRDWARCYALQGKGELPEWLMEATGGVVILANGHDGMIVLLLPNANHVKTPQ